MKLEGLTGEARRNWFKAVNAQINKILGEEPDQQKELSKYLAWSKTRRELQQLAQKYGDEVLGGALLIQGRFAEGYTPSGKKVLFELNCGMTNRSRYCGTLKINGETIFTSGKIGKCYEYIFNN